MTTADCLFKAYKHEVDAIFGIYTVNFATMDHADADDRFRKAMEVAKGAYVRGLELVAEHDLGI